MCTLALRSAAATNDPRPLLRFSCRVVALLGLLLEGYLAFSAVELEDWKEQPEEYHLLQDSIETRESVRVSRPSALVAH